MTPVDLIGFARQIDRLVSQDTAQAAIAVNLALAPLFSKDGARRFEATLKGLLAGRRPGEPTGEVVVPPDQIARFIDIGKLVEIRDARKMGAVALARHRIRRAKSKPPKE